MSSRDIYNQKTKYNSSFDTRTRAPVINERSSRTDNLTQLRRDDQAGSSSQQQFTRLQRDVDPRARHRESSPEEAKPQLSRSERDFDPPTFSSGQTAKRPATTAPPNARSHLRSAHDIQMATKQVNYDTMSSREKEEQDRWALDFVQNSGPCPAGFDWVRVSQGYVCNGSHHLMTDELVAEGKGGFYVGRLNEGWWGPCYSLVEAGMVGSGHPVLPATHEEHPEVAKCRAEGKEIPMRFFIPARGDHQAGYRDYLSQRHGYYGRSGTSHRGHSRLGSYDPYNLPMGYYGR